MKPIPFFLLLLVSFLVTPAVLTAQDLTRNKQVANRYFEEVINQQNVALVPDLFAPQFTYYDLHDFSQITDKVADFQNVLRGFFKAFPDAHYTVENMLAEGDKVFAQITVTATHKGDFMGMPASNNKLRITEMYLLTLQNGRIAESRRLIDFQRFFSQIAGK